MDLDIGFYGILKPHKVIHNGKLKFDQIRCRNIFIKSTPGVRDGDRGRPLGRRPLLSHDLPGKDLVKLQITITLQSL
jgi:hypothetical protein